MRATSEKNPKRGNQRLRKNVRSTSDIALQNQAPHNPMIALQEQIPPVTMAKKYLIQENQFIYTLDVVILNRKIVEGIGWFDECIF